MEKENEVIENLFDEETTKVEENTFAEVPPVAPANYEEPVVDNPFGVPLIEEQQNDEVPLQEQVQEEKGMEELVNEDTYKVEENAFVDLPPVAPVNYEEKNENQVEVESELEEQEAISEEKIETSSESLNKEVLEHPDAKIKLNNEKEEEIDKQELEELKNIKLMDNSSLRFVLILGVILLIVIFLIPIVSEYI